MQNTVQIRLLMMRNGIRALSIILLVLAGAVTLKALLMQPRGVFHHVKPADVMQQGISPQVEEALGKFAREQAENRLRVEELQATIAKLEKELSSNRASAKPALPNPAPQKKGRILGVIGGGDFHPGQDGMNEKMTKAIEALAPDILQSPDHRVIVEGHTDRTPIRSSAGRYMDNMDLSYLRAKAVARILEKKGVPPERISVIGYGDTRPTAADDTETGRAKNRRVEIKLVPMDKES